MKKLKRYRVQTRRLSGEPITLYLWGTNRKEIRARFEQNNPHGKRFWGWNYALPKMKHIFLDRS